MVRRMSGGSELLVPDAFKETLIAISDTRQSPHVLVDEAARSRETTSLEETEHGNVGIDPSEL